MKHIKIWVSALALVSLIACSREFGDDSIFRIKERGVYACLDPILEEGAVDTRAFVEPENGWKYKWETGDRINIWSQEGTLLIYKVVDVDEKGRAHFDGGGFTLTDGETYYSSHPLISSMLEDYDCLSTTYEGQIQAANSDGRNVAGYVYTYTSAVCENNNILFQYHHLSSFIRFVITVPKAMTLKELTLTADGEIFALDGKANMSTGEFTPGRMSDVMTLGLNDIELTEGNLVLNAYMAIAPCDAANYVIRVKDSEGTVYSSPVMSKGVRRVGYSTTFETEVFEGDSPVVAKIGDEVYTSLAEAVNAVPADGTPTAILMMGNERILGNAGVSIPAGKNVILDLNGVTITGVFDSPTTAQAIRNLGTLTITDSSAGQGGTITIEVSDENAGSPMDKNWASNVIRNDGSLIVSAGNIVNTGNGGGCYAIDGYGSGSITVNGGNVDAVRASAIRLFYPNGGSLTVNDGTIGNSSSYMGVQVMGSGTNGVSVNLNGGTFSGTYAFYVGSGSSWASSQFTISGGTFDNGVGFTGSVSADNIDITGGEFGEYLISWGTVKFINGGTFTEDSMNESYVYLAEGYKFVQDGDNYIVVPNSDPREAVVPDLNLVYYYWYDNGEKDGGFYDFYAPFEGPDPVLMDGEFIELLTNIKFTKDVSFVETCSFGDPIFMGGSFGLTFGDFDINLNGYKFPLPTGVSVKTDKQTNIFSAAESGYTVVETAITESEFHYQYSVVACVAKIGDVEYATLAEAMAAVPMDGTLTTITLMGNADGDGVKAEAGQNVVIDFNGYTYDVDGDLVGSTGTQTQAMQLLQGATVTLKNGTLTSSKALFLIQNYSDLTLENMTLTLNNTSYTSAYTLSNNNGVVVIDGSTINANPAGGFAFDVCRYASYPSVDVTVKGESVINGNVEVSASGGNAMDGFRLMLEDGTLNGDIVLDPGAKAAMAATPNKAVIMENDAFGQDAPAGYKWVSNGDGTSTLEALAVVAMVDGNEYETLDDAFAAATDGSTITLTADCAGNGIVAPQGKFNSAGLTVDFNGHAFTMDGAMVGSTGTQTQAMQLLKENKITFKNGTITSEKAKMLVQNYSNLTLENMTLTLNNASYTSAYTLSNNNGVVVIDGSTINANPAGGFAFDVCRYASYPSVDVTVKGESVINGNVEVSASGGNAMDGFRLMLEDGTLNGDIVLDPGAKAAMAATPNKAVIMENDAFGQDAPAGYKWVSNGDGTSTLKAIVATVNGVEYATLDDAFAAATDGSTITLTADCAGNGIVAPQGKFNSAGLTVDFDGHTFTMDGAMVGSTGTQTLAMQLLKENKITFKNGTITSEKAKMLVQNYSNLTLENMTLTLNNTSYTSAYTLSNNNGVVVIDGSTINANPAGGFAFDVCRYASYSSVDVTVKGGSVINGKVEVSASNSDAKDGFGLTLTSGTMTGNIVITASAKAAMAATPEKAVITKSDSFAKDAPDGFTWVSNGDGTSTLKISAASVNGVEYATLADAMEAVPTSGTQTMITLMADTAGNGVKAQAGQNVVIDFNGYTYDVDGSLVGSTGTQTLAMQLLKGSTVTMKNGTLTSKKASMLIQNYSNLTLENMTIDASQAPSCSYALSNNCGTVSIIGSTSITAYAGKNAFDVCWAPNNGYPQGAQVTVNTTGTINGKIEYDLWGTNAMPVLSTLNIVAGNFVNYQIVLVGNDDFKATAVDNIQISGGTFDADPSAYVAAGHQAILSEGKYIVQ